MSEKPKVVTPPIKVNTYDVMRDVVEEHMRYGWHRVFKYLEEGQLPEDEVAIGTLVDNVMNGICEKFRFED